jgi:tetratricopeptide (TPR) repeat protein
MDARPGPSRRSTYVDALALYEQAVRTLQQHNFLKAADLLRHMVASFPEERELIERSRVYLALCERQLQPLTAEPQNTAERLYAATLALNAGELDSAVRHLERILEDQPAHDQALYMLAVSYAQREEVADAIRYLQQAIEANPENRALARMDPDLDDLRDDDAVCALLEPSSALRAAAAKRTARRS